MDLTSKKFDMEIIFIQFIREFPGEERLKLFETSSPASPWPNATPGNSTSLSSGCWRRKKNTRPCSIPKLDVLQGVRFE
jgi:hypothetical protein